MSKITVTGSNTTYEDLHFIDTPLVVEAEWVECDGFWFVRGGEFSPLFPDRNFHSRYYFFPSEVEGNV